MKTLFIEAKLNESLILPKEHLRQLPKNIGLITNVQHVHKLPELKEQIEKSGRKVTLLKGFHTAHPGQTFGCDFPELIDDSIDAILFVGTGNFHPRGMFKSKKTVYIYDPVNKNFHKTDSKEAEKEEKKKKGAMLKFLHSTEIGVVVSTKPGQLHLKAGQELKNMFKEKNFYFLLCDTIDFAELQNFPFIECFVNTSCPRLMEDREKFPKPVINIEDAFKISPAEKKHPLFSGKY